MKRLKLDPVYGPLPKGCFCTVKCNPLPLIFAGKDKEDFVQVNKKLKRGRSICRVDAIYGPFRTPLYSTEDVRQRTCVVFTFIHGMLDNHVRLRWNDQKLHIEFGNDVGLVNFALREIHFNFVNPEAKKILLLLRIQEEKFKDKLFSLYVLTCVRDFLLQ